MGVIKKYEFSDLADSEGFESFVRMFTDLTNIPVGVRHPTKPINKLYYSDSDMNPICRYIRSTPQGLKACRRCDNQHYNCMASESEDNNLYICHAGLLDFCMPIYINNDLLAYLGCGQIMYEKPNEAGFKRICSRLSNLGLDKDILRQAYFQSPFILPPKINAALKLIMFIPEYFSEAGRLERTPGQFLEHPEVTEAKKYVHKNYQQSITVKQVADRVFLSENYFSRLFCNVAGENFTHYLQRVRIGHAKKLLETTDWPITRIGFYVGFGSVQYFNEVFRKLESCSPREYRKKNVKSVSTKTFDFTAFLEAL